MLPKWGVFDYVVVVPVGPVLPNGTGWRVESRDHPETEAESQGDPDLRARFVGISPLLEIKDGGMVSNPSSKRPAVSRARFRLKASKREDSTAFSATFYVDHSITQYFQAGDRLHMVRSGTGDLGVSLIRANKLVFAIGAASIVPLGEDVRVRTPWDVVDRMTEILRISDSRFGTFLGPYFPELPIEVNFDGENHVLFRRGLTLGNYDIWVEHGFIPAFESSSQESVAIWDNVLCGSVTVIASAQLLEDGLEIVDWRKR